ncbi:small acid-soluble spore protein Tlp [Peribacillus muralis]|uniref:Small, acid-soluble spore protein Tlp n=1 Tax=Peribacillus muralis TaxID=264697 RepID=A0A1B3XNN3_9BACI|nr:small acid-soluble spore protein Tlp [Peribacillus muralis]AOH54825.1 small acid-soluble spore protein Tlp [Peribacillus muralis]
MNSFNKDNRLDNVEKLQDAIHNTEQSMIAANDAISFSSAEDKLAIKAKNERRKASIEAMKEEVQDEEEARDSGYNNI